MPPFMVRFIEQVRIEIDARMIINSACRCPFHNAKVGGKIDSAHLQGLAIDVKVESDGYRGKILRAAYQNGARGVGIYPTFLHLDLMPRIVECPAWIKLPGCA